MIVAIDGPAGSGKSSTARTVARKLGILHLDTGAMYRAVTLKCLREGISFGDEVSLKTLIDRTNISFTGTPPDTQTWIDGENVTDAIRGDEVTKNVSDYCKPAVIRNALVDRQRLIGKSADAVICEGRDVGTVVFPEADFKFFMIASTKERAQRRQKDFEKLGITKSINDLMAEIDERDLKDSSRSNSPLRKADDALEIDTTKLEFEEQVNLIINKIRAEM